MNERYDDVWVCQDCYFAHHYGAHQEEYEVTVMVGDFLATIDQLLWFSGGDDEPVGGWHEIQENHTLEHNREPLGYLGDFKTADNTCSNHEWEREMECPVCDDGSVAEIPGGEYGFQYVWCWVCEGSGTISWPCSECRQDTDDDGIQEFSWSACDGCHSSLGGSRHRLSLWKRVPQPQGA